MDRFLTTEEVAEALGLSTRTVRRRLKSGSIRKAPLEGRAVRISPLEMARLVGGAPQAEAENNSSYENRLPEP